MAERDLFKRRVAGSPLVYSIPAHRSFSDALASGLIKAMGSDPLALAHGRILVPNNRAVRTITEAFVRVSANGLILPRLIPIGDPDIGERIGGALDPLELAEKIPAAIEPLERLLVLARLLPEQSAAESMRLAAELARTFDELTIEEVPPSQMVEAVEHSPELAAHWLKSIERFRTVVQHWPEQLAKRGLIDLTERRSRLLHGLAERWSVQPPRGFTIVAGVSTAAPAVTALVARIARLDLGAVVLPAVADHCSMPPEEWEALGPNDDGIAEEGHPQYHLKRLLDRIGVSRDEIRQWHGTGRATSSRLRGKAVVHAMAAPRFSDKWIDLPPPERRLTGIRVAELPDQASEAQAIAIALREAVEEPGKTAALVTPDRGLAQRVSAHLARWGIEADDSAGQPLSQSPAGTLLLGIAAAIVENLAPVALLALLKHPLVGGEGDQRLAWLEAVRQLDIGLRGPRPRPGLQGLEERVTEKGYGAAWGLIRPHIAPLGDRGERRPLSGIATALRDAAGLLAGDAAWRGPDGRLAAELLAQLEQAPDAAAMPVESEDIVPILRQLMSSIAVRRPYGGHPRVFIWGLIEARLQKADLMVLGSLNEGSWPPQANPDPWLAPQIRRTLGLPGLDFRSGLAAHDFMCALGAPRVLLTRARRDSRSPTVASRLWLRLQAMTGGMTRDQRLERLAIAIDASPRVEPVGRPAPAPPLQARPKKIAVTDLDRLRADPFAFYAKAILKLRQIEPVDAEHHAAWRGTTIHGVLEAWFKEDGCDPGRLKSRAREMLADEAIHPMLRALWSPRVMEAIEWIAAEVAEDRGEGREPLLAEEFGEAMIAGVDLNGKIDRVDRLPDGRLAIVDYKTGRAPKTTAVAAGFALQLGLLSLIVRAGGFNQLSGDVAVHEYWSLAKDQGRIGYRRSPDKDEDPQAFVEKTFAYFADAVARWLTGEEPFWAKLNPAYGPYGDYDQLMRLEEWYGRD